MKTNDDILLEHLMVVDKRSPHRSPVAMAVFVLGLASLVPGLIYWTAIPLFLTGSVELYRIARNTELAGGKRLVQTGMLLAALSLAVQMWILYPILGSLWS